MRLALLNQFYPPDLAPTGQLAASLARHRADLGDEVTVVAGRGRYVPQTVLSPDQVDPRIGIHRLWTPGLGKGTLIRRAVDYAWFYFAAAMRLMLLTRQDLVISLTTPPFIAWAAVLHKWLHPRTRLMLWNMDCYPEALIRAGLIREQGWIARLLRWQSLRLLEQVDHVACLDQAMEQLVRSRFAEGERSAPTSVIPNWEPARRFLKPGTVQSSHPGSSVDLESKLSVIHVGNAGYGHQFDTVASAAEMLRDEPVAFVFVGGGAGWRWLENAKRVRELAHWHLLPYLPEGQLQAVLSTAGCALITLRDSFLGVISPSKLHAALAMGLPILYIGPAGSNVDEAVQRFGCGVSLRHGDVAGVAGFLRRLASDAAFSADVRRRARRAFETAYSDAQALPAFDRVIEARSG
jgi:glycosyltransferase involved in cell wall biosynthesis